MLICSVSLRPRRSAIAADVAEITAAVDALATGNVVFATLVDDPASVGEIVDAYLGEIMLEAASAGDVITAGSAYAAAVDEATIPADSPDASITPAAALATLDGVSTNATLSNGNLTATHNLNAVGGARSASTKTTGKYYFEITVSGSNSTGNAVGTAQFDANYANVVSLGTICSVAYFSNGNIWSNGSNSGKTLGAVVAGNVVGVAIDLAARKCWLRKNAGNWNGDATHDPATGAGGVTVTATTAFGPIIGFGVGASSVGDAVTFNFGGTSFANAAPSGFGNWPA